MRASPTQYVVAAARHVRTLAHKRLTQVYDRARQVLFDDTSRIVFFSDSHRGNNDGADGFARNEGLFLHALNHYYRHGFTYVEVGDGDELWQNRRFSDVRRAHGRVFDLFQKFNLRDRLHLIVGNHEVQFGRRDRVEKDGLVAREGLVLDHAKTGQRVFVVHGHQADFKSDQLRTVSQIAVWILKHLQRLGLAREANLPDDIWTQCRIDRRIREWAQTRQQMVICGHTHRPACATHGTPLYFNTGSCLIPGAITGLEVQGGRIALVRWSARPGTDHRSPPGVRRELVVPPRQLRLFG